MPEPVLGRRYWAPLLDGSNLGRHPSSTSTPRASLVATSPSPGTIVPMSTSYHEALATLYQAPHEAFVAERKRLAAQLKASGDAAGAARLAKLARPSVSAWVVNQLWWHEPATFREMFATAEQLRGGKLAASGPHRQAMAQLVARARKLLGEGGHAASEATLRRVQMTLSASRPRRLRARTRGSAHQRPRPTRRRGFRDDGLRRRRRREGTA